MTHLISELIAELYLKQIHCYKLDRYFENDHKIYIDNIYTIYTMVNIIKLIEF